MAGWIKIHTKLLDWEWASCPETMALWIHILLRANYEDRRWQGIMVPRGSLVTGRKELAKNTGLSEQQVRTSLNRLISTNEITISSTNKYTIITICKYDDYQMMESESNQENNQDSNQQATSNQPTNNQQSTTTAEYKTIKKEYLSKDKSSKESPEAVLGEIEPQAKEAVCKRKTSIDTSFVDPVLSEIFQEFLDMRRKIGKPLRTQKGVKDRYEKLMILSGGNIDLALRIARQTLGHEWQDFYELKEEKHNQPQQQNYSNENYW